MNLIDQAVNNLVGSGFNRNIVQSFVSGLGESNQFTQMAANNFAQIQQVLDQGHALSGPQDLLPLLGLSTNELPNNSPTNDAVSDSTISDNQYSPVNSTDEIRQQLETDLANFETEVSSYQEYLNEAEQNTLNDITSSYDTQIGETKQQQKGVKGQRTLMLAGSGALGRTISGQSNLVQLEQAQTAELNALEQKKQSAIAAARNAYREKDFELMQYKLEQVNKLKKEANDLVAAQQEARLKQAKETREQLEFELMIKEKQNNVQKSTAENLASGLVNFKLADGTIDVPDQTQLESIAADYEIDPLILLKAINDRMDDVRKIQNENFQDYFNIAKQLPEGDEVAAPDGTIIKGIKSRSGDIITYEATISGRKYKVGADKLTGEVKWQNPIGTAGGGGGVSKTITWAQAKELGDLSLYGQPVAEMYKATEELTFDEWLLQKNMQDPRNYPLASFDVNHPIYSEYADYLLSNTSPADNLENKLYLKSNPDEAESYAIDIINENSYLIDTGEETPESLIQFVIQSTGLTYSKAKSIVNDQLGL